MKKIVYFGMGFLPSDNAVAFRMLTIANLVHSINYEPILIGISKSIKFGEYTTKKYNGVKCYEVKYPESITERIYDTFIIQNEIKTIFNEIGIENIQAFIMQDYQLFSMMCLSGFCKNSNIAFIVDAMDWFSPNSDYSLFKNIFKTLDTFVRIRCWYPFVKNKICISSSFVDYFKNKNNLMLLPCTFPNSTIIKKTRINETNTNVIITFAGACGKHFNKEKLDWAIKALYENKSSIELNIIGIEKNIIDYNKSLCNYLTSNVHFYGNLSHEKCIDLLLKSDFSVIVRENNKLSKYGFSSKICEAFAYCIPVIVTDNSDNKLYVENGKNGYVCGPNYYSFKELLKNIESLKKEKIMEMKNELLHSNPLSEENYISAFAKFIDVVCKSNSS